MRDWFRAALLTLPLGGCAAPSKDSAHTPPPHITQPALDMPELSAGLHAPPGLVLSGLIYADRELRPVFSPLGSAAQTLSPTEIRLLGLLLSERWSDRNQALLELGSTYIPRLEPALRTFLGGQHDSHLADRAILLLAFHGSDETIAELCTEIQYESGVRLKRAVDVLRHRPTSAVIAAMCTSMRSSGFGEKEGRDEGLVVGKALATMGPSGVQFLSTLLSSPDPATQVAGAASLATVGNLIALPVLLRHAEGEDSIVRREALMALGAFPTRAEILPPLRRALAELDLSSLALDTLQRLGVNALPVLSPYTDVDYFSRSGIERRGHNQFLPGVAYGDIVTVIQGCLRTAPDSQSTVATNIRDAIRAGGIVKLISDLDSVQLRPGALNALIALEDEVFPYIPALVSTMSARELLLNYPTRVILDRCDHFLSGEITTPLTDMTCELLALGIGRLIEPDRRRRAFEEILLSYPEAPWLRHLTELLWRETAAGDWVTAALRAVPDSKRIRRILDECAAAAQLDISVPLRWSEPNLAEIVRNRTLASFDGRPIATLVYAEADFNGAFARHNSIVAELIRAGYCVRYYDECTDVGVLRAIAAAVSRPSSDSIEPAALLILGAHSNQTEMRFGSGNDATEILSLGDIDLITQSPLRETVRKDGHVILIACNAGEGRETQANLANMFGHIFEPAAIWSTEVPDNLKMIVLDPEGAVTDVKFNRDKVYRR